MRKKILIGSIIAITLIVLSSFSSVVGKVASDNELVEIEVEFCGLGKKHTVRLTQQEADEVELLFGDIEQRLSEVETREEAEVIFKEAIVELDKYGLLGGLPVKQAQSLIKGNRQINSILKRIEFQNSYLINMNLFCLIAGQLTDVYSFRPIHQLFWIIYKHFPNLGDNLNPPEYIKILIILILLWYNYISPLVNTISPVNIFNIISVGFQYDDFWGGHYMKSSKGSISSLGLLGFKQWSGDDLYSCALKTGITIPLSGAVARTYYPAIIGFTGLKIITRINFDTHLTLLLGFGLKISLSDVRPRD